MARASPAFKATMTTSEALKIEKGGNRSDKSAKMPAMAPVDQR
jgi:hypothetical protein